MARIVGTKELRRALKKLPPDLRNEAMVEVRNSTKSMHQKAMMNIATASKYAELWHGKMGMQNITGVARRNYRYSVSERQMVGRVGLLSTTAASRAFYLKYFLFGSSHQPARPAHDEAFEDEAPIFIDNQKKALVRVLARL